ncbi:ABC transporter ATP-binding protein [Pseudochrobactrum sp. MP213Fo]|uniref:ABC transporter ATP-binding protein n=1 Tax=Pseudochrobactrum sp. MP213Fo TaxID=3022250 RepID=UPI003BA1963A
MSDQTTPLLRIENLDVHFPVSAGLFRKSRQAVRAVNDFSLDLYKGECLSIVGESGCGKSTLALSILGLQKPTAGTIYFEGKPITGAVEPDRLERAKMAQMVFQDPYASLNPRQTIYKSLAAPLRLQGITTKSEVNDRVERTMKLVGLKPEQATRLPHEFSGGQRQRIGIARALVLNPKVVVLDEPVSALDVSIRAQIINLLLELKDELQLSYIMISHDLSVVEHMSDRVAVMYFGQVVEQGPWQRVFSNPIHPYTRRLMGAIPDPFAIVKGEEVLKQDDAPPPPQGYEYFPREFGTHDVYTVPPATELLTVEDAHQVRFIAR